MEKRVRMVDIAEKMGVSTFTVSKALSGKDGVSEEMREEVRRVAEEMGYQTKSKSKIESASKGMKFGILTRSKYIEQGQSFYWSLYERMLYHLNAGSVEVGKPADIVIFDEQEKGQAGPFLSKSQNSPFAGEQLDGVVQYTICGGKLIYSNIKKRKE